MRVTRIISTDGAAAAVGAYSQATTNGDLLFTAGQLPLTADGDLLDDAPVDEQTAQCLRNVEAVLAAEGLDASDVLKTTVFLDDIDDFDAFDAAYSDFFDDEPPARSAVGVADVPKGAAVEIEVVADAG
ncbi:reactive intermediate/imine deaminase [Halarchaeum nitratireducens]|uniref:Reactive intermediate/imine deaminase n=1 Tax=Halarchaeum nitratireducens TaxID=489913 RepID=A0A830GDB7_9EURY|nr:reactive intermediate/imine deaminase [Halarchaeum nitratireducens]